MIDFVIGGPATDSDFLFREEFIEDLWDSARKNNILLLAPRRMGKTSIMHQLMEEPRENWIVVYLNVEELESPGDFCLHLIDALNEDHPDFIRQTLAKSWDFIKDLLTRVEVDAGDFKIALKDTGLVESWNERADQLISRLNRWGRGNNRKFFFLIDELPDMLGRMGEKAEGELETFLHWFRKIRIDPKSSIRWLLGGSVNIEGTLGRIGQLKAINDLQKESLPPFSSEEVSHFVAEMLRQRSVEFEPEIPRTVQDLLGEPIPFFLQLLTQELYRYWRRNKHGKLAPADVKTVFEKHLLGATARDKLQHFRSRIELYYPEEEKAAAYHLLDHLSVADKGCSRKTLFSLYQQVEGKKTGARGAQILKNSFNTVLLFLESDFYILENMDKQYDFTSKLLKKWWKKYYGYNV